MAEGITGWRLHVGVIFPTPVPPRAVLEFYEAVPEGVDMTTVSLTIRQLSDDDMDEAIKGMERARQAIGELRRRSHLPVRRSAGRSARIGFRRRARRPSVAGRRPAGDHRHVERDR